MYRPYCQVLSSLSKPELRQYEYQHQVGGPQSQDHNVEPYPSKKPLALTHSSQETYFLSRGLHAVRVLVQRRYCVVE